MRSSEVAAEASGIAVNRSKILIFALSAAIAGIGGAMLGMFSFQFTNASAPVLAGLIWLALAVTFGIRRPGGALLAGFAFAAGTAVFHWISSWSFLSGGDVQALITSVYFVPDPVGPRCHPARTGARRHPRPRRPAEAAPEAREGAPGPHRRGRGRACTAARSRSTSGTTAPKSRRNARSWPRSTVDTSRSSRADEAAFAVRGVVAGYGDAEVLHGVDLRVDRGKVTALLGANGAGKSTLCAVAAGMVDASIGKVFLEGKDITDTEPFRRARDGVLLVPEARGIFPGLTVEENLTVLLRDDAAPHERLRALPDPLGAAQAGGRPPLGWRAADAEPRARPRRPADRAHRRRADARPRAPRRRTR